jgi:hypothetical protein
MNNRKIIEIFCNKRRIDIKEIYFDRIPCGVSSWLLCGEYKNKIMDFTSFRHNMKADESVIDMLDQISIWADKIDLTESEPEQED